MSSRNSGISGMVSTLIFFSQWNMVSSKEELPPPPPPRLFCIHIDGLLNELQENGSGSYMGEVFAGAFA